jgi:hypothetical protein
MIAINEIKMSMSKTELKAIECLEEYIKSGGSIEEILKEPDLSKLRADSRYSKLVEKFNRK